MELRGKKIFCVFAHPDDESYIVGGTIALAAQHEAHVTVISVTKGDKGFQNVRSEEEKERLTEIREQEMKHASEILGTKKIVLWDYPDGGLDTLGSRDDELVQRLIGEIQNNKPDMILTFGPDGVSGHRDHIAIGRFAARVGREEGIPAWGITYPKELNVYLERVIAVRNKTAGHFKQADERYNAAPNLKEVVPVDIASVFEIKCQACRAHQSQDPEGLIRAWLEQPEEFWRYEYFISL